jgi:LPS export ABC transporter permease LptG
VAHIYGESSAEAYRQAEGFDEFRQRLDPAAYLKAFLAPPEKAVQDLTPREVVQDIRETEAAIVEKTPAPSPVTGERPASAEVMALEHRLTRAKIELHQRMALPLASFFFAILALPLGVSRVRSGKGAGFAMSMLVIVVYWVSFTFTRDQAVRGRLSPDWGPWIANAIILVWAVVALWRMKRMPWDGRGPLAWVIGSGFRLARWVRDRNSSRAARAATDEPGAELETFSGTTTRFIARLDQYIGAQFVRILFLSMFSAYLVYMLVETKRMMDALLRTQQPPSLIFSYFKYFIPGTLHLVLPISCLIAAVVTFTVLSRTGELTAIKATGISMRRATFAVILITALLCAVLFLVQDRIAPTANRKAQTIQDQISGRAPRTYGLPRQGMWAFGPEGQRLYHYVLYDPEREEFQGLRVFTIDRRRPRIVDHRFSERARWRGDHWELEGGWFRAFPEDGEVVFEVNEGVLELPLDPPKNFASREVSLTSADELPDQMSLAELKEQIATLKKSGYDITQLVVAYHSKIARALTPLVMVLLGLPFAFRVGRRGSLYGIGVAVLLVLVYWATFAVFHALGQETVLDPRVAAWAPNVMFGLFGVYLMLYVKT